MKKIILLITVFLFVCSAHPAMAQDENAPHFFNTLNDVPLMNGLEELVDQAVIFDKAEGRIAESSAVTDEISISEIQEFYDNTLPQLGWQKTESGVYVRRDEMLQMNVDEESDYNVVRFMVSPQ